MNWQLKNGRKETVQDFLAGWFSETLAEGIEKFAPLLGTVQNLISFDGEDLGPDAHGPAGYSEWPDGEWPVRFVRHPSDGVAYRYTTTMGFYENGRFVSTEPPKYTLAVTGLGEQRSYPFTRKRQINNVHPIS